MEKPNVISEKKFGYGVRHIQTLCMTLNLLALFIARSSLGVAILAMTDMTRRNDPNVYDWDKKTQSLILSSFFVGYILMQIPGGLLAKRYGGKPVILSALLANGVICAILPSLVQFGGWQIVCACRILLGLTQACLVPSTHTLLGKWLPAHEMTSYSGIVYGGLHFGNMISMPLSGFLADTKMGWKLIFYVIAGILFATAAVWTFFSANSPGEHRFITNEEKEYIEKGLNVASGKALKTPWKRILTTTGFWALVVSHIGSVVGYILFFVDMPTYLEKGLQISLKNSATLSALPYMGMAIGNFVSTQFSEKLFNKGFLTLLACRKLCTSIGFVGMTLGLIVLSFIGPENKVIAIIALTIALGSTGFWGAGFLLSYIDLSPNYGGVMFSISNCISNVGSVITPIVTSFILQNDPTDITRWRIVFLITAGISMLANAGFMLFATAERQEWDDPHYLEKKKTDPEELQPALEPETTS
ncbi:putative inorganic phosphate cotransporter [Melitaea cinxia]|uniref:putative inorganic phosphate cotransporter n=1 Tax=Melitaea cinxia TaxID=113334 RepID=UPI001E26F07D|nr:putative inorganic phosphate cotransporter [Melitaea cinxia]